MKKRAGGRRSAPHEDYRRTTPVPGQVKASEPQESGPANLGTDSGAKGQPKAVERQAMPWKSVVNARRKARAVRARKTSRNQRFAMSTRGLARNRSVLES